MTVASAVSSHVDRAPTPSLLPVLRHKSHAKQHCIIEEGRTPQGAVHAVTDDRQVRHRFCLLTRRSAVAIARNAEV